MTLPDSATIPQLWAQLAADIAAPDDAQSDQQLKRMIVIQERMMELRAADAKELGAKAQALGWRRGTIVDGLIHFASDTFAFGAVDESKWVASILNDAVALAA